MAELLTITREDGHAHSCRHKTTVADLFNEHAPQTNGLPVVGALYNNDMVSLTFPLEVDGTLTPLTMRDPHGWRMYRRSASFLLAKTVSDLYPDAQLKIEHSLGSGLYCSFEQDGEAGIGDEALEQLQAHMMELVERDVPILRRKLSFTDAVRYFEERGQQDKYNLLRFRNPPRVVVYDCEGFTDLAHGPLASSAGALRYFRLIPYPPGFVMQFPERETAPHMPPFEQQPHLFQIFKEHKEWGRILGIQTVGQLNEVIFKREIGDLVKIAEAFHEKNIARIADTIAARRDHVRCVCIAGPSSAGKTTFSKRLSVQLRVNGLRPVMISVDDYFVDRNRTPLDDDGQLDFEHVETIDLELFNEHLERLDRGEEVELPRFNFEKGAREYRGITLRIARDQIVIVEGIHALNPRLTQLVPPEHKFKIYLSALTQLNLDQHNRISTTDNRLMRRMVRDYQFRGNSALATLTMWPSVRRGEKKWIFPFQKEADVAFNSALDYELAALKPLAEPLLREVKPSQPQYAEARRMLDFLESFLTVPHESVPATSILREFIGKSSFRY